MRLAILPIVLPTLFVGSDAFAELSLFGTPSHAPTNPFASNYASTPVRDRDARGRRAPRPATRTPQPLRPPRDIPR